MPTANNNFEIHAAAEPNRKRRGEVAEAVFLARACSFGFRLAKPWGDSERYDFIVTFGHGFHRVQVKSTERYAESRYRVKGAGWKDTYTPEEIDFLVAYIVPIEAFASRKSLRFYPHGKSKGLLEKYREAWCLMACALADKFPKKQKAGSTATLKPCSRKSTKRLESCRCPELEVRCALCPLLQ
jgi:hypothetical protein